MPYNKFTDEQIIKALELCRKNEVHSTCEHCLKCPLSTCDLVSDEENCLDALYRRSINLINRQKAENDRLKGMVSQNEGVLPQYEALIKSEAIREFAERLKRKSRRISEYDEGGWCMDIRAVKVEDIDNLVKEMTEGQP